MKTDKKTVNRKDTISKSTSSYNPAITKEDIDALGEKSKHLRTDGGRDSHLTDRVNPVDFEGKDLDIPGRSNSKAKPDGNLSDEENRHHSLGSSDNSELKHSSDF